MRSLALVFVLLCVLTVFVPVVLAEDEVVNSPDTTTTTVTSDTPENSSASLPVKPVPPEAAAAKFEGLFNKGYDVIAKTITSLAVFVFAFCCAVLLFASIFKVEFARKFGLGGIFCAGLGLLIFYSIPFIISFIQGIGNYLNS